MGQGACPRSRPASQSPGMARAFPAAGPLASPVPGRQAKGRIGGRPSMHSAPRHKRRSAADAIASCGSALAPGAALSGAGGGTMLLGGDDQAVEAAALELGAGRLTLLLGGK